MKVTYTGKGLYRIGEVTMKFPGKEYIIEDSYIESVKKAESKGFLKIHKEEVKEEPSMTLTIKEEETPKEEVEEPPVEEKTSRRRGRRKKAE